MQNEVELQQTPIYLKPLRWWGYVGQWFDHENRIGPLMVLPALLIVLVLVAYPFGNAVYLSLTDTRAGATGMGDYIGLKNFEDLLNQRMPRFVDTIVVNTLQYTFGAVLLKLVFGMTLALLLNRAMPFKNFIRGIILLPWVVPTALSVMAWRWMLDDHYSVLNYALQDLQVPGAPFGWRTEYALQSVIAVNIWRGTPFFAITLLAALQIVPDELLEAAQIDGANAWQRFWKIVLPTIMPVVVVTTLFSLVRTLADVEIVWLLTYGGPYNKTHLLSTYSFQQVIEATRLGKGAAVSLFLFPGFLVLVFLQLRYLQKRDY